MLEFPHFAGTWRPGPDLAAGPPDLRPVPLDRAELYAPPVVERLDEERIEMLRSWGEGLSASDRDELRAAGRAILMLIEEIDRLEADIWNERAAAIQAAGEHRSSQLLASTLRDRIAPRAVPGEPGV